MESLVKGRHIPHKSKKRVFPGDSSPGMEPETAEIYYPPGNQNPKCKTKMLKLNEDAMVVISLGSDGAIERHLFKRVHSSKVAMPNKKEKGIIMSSVPSSAIHLESVQGVSRSYKGKDHKDAYAGDCVSDDEYSRLQSCLDNLDFPTGIEAPVPCFHDCIKMKRKNLARPISSSADGQILRTQLAGLAKSTQSLASQHGSSGSTYARQQVHTHVAVHPQPQTIVVEHNDASGKIHNSLEVAGSSSSMEQIGNEDAIKKYHNFKKFDIVEDYSDHHFSTLDSAMKQANVVLVELDLYVMHLSTFIFEEMMAEGTHRLCPHNHFKGTTTTTNKPWSQIELGPAT